MPRRRKRAHELTTENVMRRLFPAKVVKAAKLEGQKARKDEAKNSTKKESS
jgi:hypothetical protein